MTFATLAANLAQVREEIARVQAAEGIAGAVAIVAVTKGHPPAAAAAAWHAGLTDVGENRVQEAVAKQDAVGVPVRWHLIGHLQTNKARFVPGRFVCVHSLDSLRGAEALSRAMTKAGGTVRVLIQVNVTGEAQKSGCPPGDAGTLVAAAGRLPGLAVDGLMTMAPFTDDEAVQRRTFAALRRVRDELASPERPLRELSMGMSGDFRAAVAEGATMLRLGTVLFGERPA